MVTNKKPSFQNKLEFKIKKKDLNSNSESYYINENENFKDSVIKNWLKQKRKNSELLEKVSIESSNKSISHLSFVSQSQYQPNSVLNSPIPNNIFSQDESNLNLYFFNEMEEFNSIFSSIYQMNTFNIKQPCMITTHFTINPFLYQRQNIHNLDEYEKNQT